MGKGRRGTHLHVFSLLVIFTTALALPSPSAKNGVTTRPTLLVQNAAISEQQNTSSTDEKTSKRRKRTKRKEESSEAAAQSSLISKRKTDSLETAQAKETKQSNKPVKEIGGREATCLRRIKREWRDAVKLGIAYDWVQMKTLGSTSADDKYAYVRIGPLGKNLLQWHFSVLGPPNSVYEGGIYHGRVLLPKTYPGSPPRIQVLNPSGRFITGEDICLSASAFHPESWTPQWTVLSLVEALRLHMLTTANEIGGKDDTPEQRRKYARASRRWRLGRIDHALMIRQGIFPWQDEVEEGEVTVVAVGDCDGGVQVAVRQTQQAPVARKQVPQSAKLPTILLQAVVDVLTSPPRLAFFFLLTVFVILNRR